MKQNNISGKVPSFVVFTYMNNGMQEYDNSCHPSVLTDAFFQKYFGNNNRKSQPPMILILYCISL